MRVELVTAGSCLTYDWDSGPLLLCVGGLAAASIAGGLPMPSAGWSAGHLYLFPDARHW